MTQTWWKLGAQNWEGKNEIQEDAILLLIPLAYSLKNKMVSTFICLAVSSVTTTYYNWEQESKNFNLRVIPLIHTTLLVLLGLWYRFSWVLILEFVAHFPCLLGSQPCNKVLPGAVPGRFGNFCVVANWWIKSWIPTNATNNSAASVWLNTFFTTNSNALNLWYI